MNDPAVESNPPAPLSPNPTPSADPTYRSVLIQIVRADPAYRQNGQLATALLAEVERQSELTGTLGLAPTPTHTAYRPTPGRGTVQPKPVASVGRCAASAQAGSGDHPTRASAHTRSSTGRAPAIARAAPRSSLIALIAVCLFVLLFILIVVVRSVLLRLHIEPIISAMAPVVSGRGVPGAAVYNPKEPGPHHIVLMSTSGMAYGDWNAKLPDGWSPPSVSETELVALIGPEREITLGSQAYKYGASDITAYRYEVDIELREAHTGKTLATWTFKGSDPPPFPETAPPSQTRLEGTHFVYADLEDWLCPSVNGCVGLLRTLKGHTDYVLSVAFSARWAEIHR